MPLKLVTGPANAEKARVVLDSYRAALKRGEEPILVVPTLADVEHYRRDLAGDGVVFAGRSFRARLALVQGEDVKWRVEFDEPWAKEGAKAAPATETGDTTVQATAAERAAAEAAA